MTVIRRVNGLNKSFEFIGVLIIYILRSKINYVNRNVVLFEILGQLNQLSDIIIHGASNKHNNSLPLILILSIL